MKEIKKTNQKNNNKQKGKCPFCKTVEESINGLNINKDFRKRNMKISQKVRLGFYLLIIILGVAGGYKILSDFSLTNSEAQEDLVQKESINSSEKTDIEIGLFAPDFVLEDVYGNKIALSDYRDKKPVLLIFWATWCGYCAKELPDLKVFNQKHSDNIQVVTIASGETKETVKEYVQDKEIDFLILLDEQRKIWNQYLIRGTPSHFLIGKDGKIITMRPGLASLANLEIMFSMTSVE